MTTSEVSEAPADADRRELESETAEVPETVDTGRSSRRRASAGRRAWLVVPLIALVFGIAGGLYVLLSPTSYSASTLVQIDAGLVASNDSPDNVDQQEISTQRLVMSSQAVAAEVVKSLQLDRSASSLSKNVSVEQVNDSRVIRLTATASSPDGAAAVANAFATEYLKFRAAQRDTQLTQAAGDTDLVSAPVGEVLTPAVARNSPAGTSPVVVIVLSVLLGLLLGLALFYARNAAARRSVAS